MKTVYLLPAAIALTLFFSTGCEDPGDLTAETSYQSTADSVSYGLGFFYGRSIAGEGVDDINYQNFLAGLMDGHLQEDPDLSEEQIDRALQNFQYALQQRREAEREDLAAINIEASRAFLEENAQRDDVHVTESGLQYRIIEEGDGERPSVDSHVRVHYRGTLIDGTEFDSSYQREDPAEFPLDQVIEGWTEGVQLMSVGSKYEFFIPSELGYGNTPPPGSPIEPGVVLIFEVELLDILD